MIKSCFRKPYGYLLLGSILISLLFHLPYLNVQIQGVHTQRQSQTMWNVRNFVRHDANILNPRVNDFNGDEDNLLRYEFPIMQWSIAMLQRIFQSESILIVRLAMFFFGAIGVLGFYVLLAMLGFELPLALAGAICFQFSPLFFRYTLMPMPDVFALSWGVWYLALLLAYIQSGRQLHAVLAMLCLMLASLAKLPFIIFGVFSLVYFFKQLTQGADNWYRALYFAFTQVLFVLPIILWYAWVIPGWNGNGILYGIFQEGINWSDTTAIFRYYWREMFSYILLSPAVWLPVALGILFIRRVPKYQAYLFGLVGITFLYFLLEYPMIRIVHDYYLLPLLPGLYIFAAIGFKQLQRLAPSYVLILVGISTLGAIAGGHFLAKDSWSLERTGYLEEVFTHSKALQAVAPDTAKVILLNDSGIYSFAYQIDKMGYVFREDYLPTPWIDDLVNRGIQYLYSSSRVVDERPDVQPYLDSLLLEVGSVRVFSLKKPNKEHPQERD